MDCLKDLVIKGELTETEYQRLKICLQNKDTIGLKSINNGGNMYVYSNCIV